MDTTPAPRHPVAACSAPIANPVAVCSLRVSASDDLTRLIPAGTFTAPRGSLEGSGPWHLDEAHARSIIERAAARSTDIVIDYEHQTLLAERNGKPAPAAGWVYPRSLEWRSDGLYGRVKWTAAASKAISPGPAGEPPEYLYLSPVFPYDAQSGDVLDLLHVALTNTPAIDTGAITELAAARMGRGSLQGSEDSPNDAPTQEVTIVDREKLIAALGLAKDATDEQIDQKLAALKAGSEDATALRQALGAKDDAKPAEVVAALKAGVTPAQPDMTQYVPKAVFDEQQQTIAALRTGSNDAELKALIEEGVKDGRIPGQATADWLKGQGLAACKAYLDGAPPIAALRGSSQTQGKPPGDDKPNAPSEIELAICRNAGITVEEYRKANPAPASTK
ncbi:phage protease [Salinicola sp. JS01]|uniref:phage protease n=1 Tax=Salinicola sp. JS01 TaxID=3050071 RepID=UPI00255B68C3|nr:phage protease [Salinicola sp. JS01]WIX34956.1 phage protease [Salinicola sp. JS01]